MIKDLYLKDYKTKTDIKYSDFIQFKALVPEGTKPEEVDVEFLTMRVLTIFYGIKPKDSRNLKQSQVTMLTEKVMKAINGPVSQLSKTIEMNGKIYGLIPNFKDITLGELIDMDKMYELERYAELTSILYRPIIGEINKHGEYEIEPYQGAHKEFSEITVDIVEGYMDFFVKSFNLLSKTILTSMEVATIV